MNIGELSVSLGIASDKSSFARAHAEIKRLGEDARRALRVNWGGTGSPFATRQTFNPALAQAQALGQAIRTQVGVAQASTINWATAKGSPFGGGATAGTSRRAAGGAGGGGGGFFGRLSGMLPNAPGGSGSKGLIDNLNQVRLRANLATRALTGMAAFTAGRGLVNLADTYTNLHNRLFTLTGSHEEAERMFQRMRQVAAATRAPLETTAETFVRVSNSTREMGLEQADVIKFVERLNMAMSMSGASASETRSGLTQMTQALAKGKLDGDEFRSIAENMPNVLQILQKSLGVTEGKLRKMSKQGKLTREAIVKAFLDADDIAGKFAKTTPTLGSKFQKFQDDMMTAFGEFAKNVDLVNALEVALTALGKVLVIVLQVLQKVIEVTKAFVQGLKEGEPWAIALAAAIGLNLIPTLVRLVSLLVGLPRLLLVFSLARVTHIALGIQSIAAAFAAAAASAANFGRALGGGGLLKGGAGLLGALGPIGAALGAAYLGTELTGGPVGAGQGGAFGLGEAALKARQGNSVTSNVNVTNNFNGVKDAEQSVSLFEQASQQVAERQLRHAAAATGR